MKNTIAHTIILAALICPDIFITLPVKAQEPQRPATNRATVHLSREELKAFEGVFRFPNDTNRDIRFAVRNDTLTAGFIINANVVVLLPDTGLSFVVKDGGDRIVFRKNAAGVVSQVYLGNNVWNRVANYKPVVKKEMEHRPDQLRPFEGLYQLRNNPNMFLRFTVKENNLVLKQLWDGNEIFFVPEGELDLFAKAIPAFTLHFTKETDGTISQVLAFKRDLWIKVVPPHLTADQLKAYEGKYQSKDDADNLIQLIVKDTGLVVKQLWDGKEIRLEPRTNTYFYNEAQSYPLQIDLDPDGKVRQVIVLTTNVFRKVTE
jgi:hypothetical protein